MKVRLFTLALAGVLLVSTSAIAQTGCITGIVLDETGNPLPRMDVHAVQLVGIDPPRKRTMADANGKFELRDVPAGSYEVGAYDDGKNYPHSSYLSLFGRPNPQITVGVSDVCQEIALRLGPQAAKLKLSVHDAITKEPVRHLAASLRHPGRQNEYSTAVPQQEVFVPALVDFEFQLEANGYENSAPMTLSLQPGEVRELSFDLLPALRGCLTGTVVDAGRIPLAGVKVFTGAVTGIGEYSAVTDAEGKFQISELDLGPHSIWTEKPSAGYPRVAQPSQTQIVQGNCREILIKLGPKAARLQINAADAVTGKPISRMVCILTVANKMILGGDLQDGRILVPSGVDLTLEIHAENYKRDKTVYIGVLAPDEEKNITIELQPLVTSSNVIR